MTILKEELKKYRKIWIISDLHGYNNLFLKILAKIKLTKNDLLIINGDSCDRGNNTADLYSKIISLSNDGFNIIHTYGNHEDLMINAVDKGELYLWYRNGGMNTIKSYKKNWALFNEHIKFVRKMPIAVDLGKYFIVHAGLNPKSIIRNQSVRDLIWIRDEFINSSLLKTNKIIIYGHTPNLDGKIAFISDQKISIDCGSYDTGVVGAFELKSKNIFYVSTDVLQIYLNPYFKK